MNDERSFAKAEPRGNQAFNVLVAADAVQPPAQPAPYARPQLPAPHSFVSDPTSHIVTESAMGARVR